MCVDIVPNIPYPGNAVRVLNVNTKLNNIKRTSISGNFKHTASGRWPDTRIWAVSALRNASRDMRGADANIFECASGRCSAALTW